MLKDTYPYYLASKAVYANTDLEVTDKYSGKVATKVALADAKAIDAGIAAAVASQEAMQAFPPYKRQAVLNHCVARFTERFEEIAQALCAEAGKPIKDARGEVSRLIDTFRVAAEESVRKAPGRLRSSSIEEKSATASRSSKASSNPSKRSTTLGARVARTCEPSRSSVTRTRANLR